VTYKPLINHSTHGKATTNAGNAQRPGPNPPGNTGAANGEEGAIPTAEDEHADPTYWDVAVDGFWRNGRRYIFDVRITDTECRTIRNLYPFKVLRRCEQLKKEKHLQACHEMRRDFTPLVYSVDADTVINGKVQPKRTKAMDIRFHWLGDRECQQQFRFYWRPGKTNYADYWTKHHLPSHHVNIRKKFLTPAIVLEMMNITKVVAPAA
jgi:hypothetical protein